MSPRPKTFELRAGPTEAVRVDLTTLAIVGGLARAGVAELDKCSPWCRHRF